MTIPVEPDDDDGGECPGREDGIHCEHWWDGDAPCCTCKAPAMSEAQMREQGMIE